ncbi:MAG: hypothetical protein WKG00_36455 [Polyangiaceae bacterium]
MVSSDPPGRPGRPSPSGEGAERGSRASDIPPNEGGGEERKRLFEGPIPDMVKRIVERAVESGVERLAEGPENLKHFADRKLPKEVLHYLYSQVDDTKTGIYRAVAKEIRDVLEHTHLSEEITKVLTKLSFEIKTEIRFIPNDAAKSSREPRPAARSPSEPRPGARSPSEPRPGARSPSEPRAADDAEDGDAPEDSDRARFPRPEVNATVSVRDRSKEGRRPGRRREEP